MAADFTYHRPGLGAQIATLNAMITKELTIMLRYPIEFVASFAQVFLIVLIFMVAGFMFAPGGLEASGSAAAGLTSATPFGFLIFIFISDTLWTIGYNVRREQKQGTLEHLYMSPASKFSSLLSRVAVMMVWSGSLGVVSLVGIGLLFGGLPLNNLPLALVALAFTLAGTIGIGFAFAGITLYIKEAGQTLANLLQFAFIVFCAPFFPFSALPEPMLWVSRLIPVSYGLDVFRSLLAGLPEGTPELGPLWLGMTVTIVFGVVMPLIGYGVYRQAEDEVRRRGTLSEY